MRSSKERVMQLLEDCVPFHVYYYDCATLFGADLQSEPEQVTMQVVPSSFCWLQSF